MQIQVGAITQDELVQTAQGEASSAIAERVEIAFQRQLARQNKANNLLSSREIDEHCKPDSEGDALLRNVMTKLNWSARAYHRVLKVARTIADLAGSAQVGRAHVAEAIQYRRALRER